MVEAALQQLRVRPSEPVKEASYITKNIQATRQAYGLENTKVINYEATTTATPAQLSKDAEVLPGIRLIDPSVVGPTFEQLQQVRGFYSFPTDLDVDRYKIGNQVRDTVIAVREVEIDRLPSGQRNWNNDHTVYTHGYGVVAANGNQRASDGAPVFSEKDLPPTGELGDYEPRIYFGEQSPDYSIVGAPKGSSAVELDTPEGKNGGDPTLNTYMRQGRRTGRLVREQVALRHQVPGREPAAVQPGEQRLEDPLRPQPARAGREGRSVADARR